MIKALAAAKINLYLDVARRREDGYHDIETFYQPVSLFDELIFERVESGVTMTGDDPAVPWNEENLCYRAARLILDHSGVRSGVRISCKKGIPSGAGLGGGSADAAATLIAVNRLLDARIAAPELLDLGSRLGSDVPFFVLGKPAIGRGRGEILERAPGLPGGWILIVKPHLSISTKWAYENLNLLLTRGESPARLALFLADLRLFPKAALAAHNSFEAGAIERFPVIASVLSEMRKAQPVLCSLSGSGSACFAVFAEEKEARWAEGRFLGKGLFTRVVQPIDDAVRMG